MLAAAPQGPSRNRFVIAVLNRFRETGGASNRPLYSPRALAATTWARLI